MSATPTSHIPTAPSLPQRSPFLTTEDWWAVWLGLGTVVCSVILY